MTHNSEAEFRNCVFTDCFSVIQNWENRDVGSWLSSLCHTLFPFSLQPRRNLSAFLPLVAFLPLSQLKPPTLLAASCVCRKACFSFALSVDSVLNQGHYCFSPWHSLGSVIFSRWPWDTQPGTCSYPLPHTPFLAARGGEAGNLVGSCYCS